MVEHDAKLHADKVKQRRAYPASPATLSAADPSKIQFMMVCMATFHINSSGKDKLYDIFSDIAFYPDACILGGKLDNVLCGPGTSESVAAEA